MGTNSYNRSYATANNTLSPILLNISLNNLSTLKSTGKIQFIGYIKIDGAIYRFVNYTDSSGYYNLNVNLSGTIAMLISTLAYKNSSEQFPFNSTANHASFNLSTAARYHNVIHLNSVYNNLWQLPDNLSLLNSLLKINITQTHETNGTNFTNYVKNGTYKFDFSNVSYIPKVFFGNVSGKDSLYNVTLTNYLLEINNNSALSWNYSINYPPGNVKMEKVVNHLTYVNLTQGQFSFSAYINSTKYGSKVFSLSSTSPNENITFNVSKYSHLFNMTSPTSSPIISFVNFSSINPGQNLSIYGIAINATWSKSLSLYLNSSPIYNVSETTDTTTGTTNISLGTYFHYAENTSLNVTLDGSGKVNIWEQSSEYYYYLLIHYYAISIHGGAIDIKS